MALLKINTENIINNYLKIRKLCDDKKLELVVVSKVCLSDINILSPLYKMGAKKFADFYAENFKQIPFDIEKMILTPGLSQLKNVVESDIFYVSDLKIINALTEKFPSKKIKIILAVELGDFREGIPLHDLPDFLQKILKIDNLDVLGIGSNLGCLIGKLPDLKLLENFCRHLHDIKIKVGFECQIVSLGGTLMYDMILANNIGKIINQVRIGEAIFFGNNMSYQKKIDELSQDTFFISGEIIEIYEKNILYEGEIGFNAFGLKSDLHVSGRRKRAVLDFGKLSAPVYGLTPINPGVKIAGSSHNHTVIDITDCDISVSVGDYIDFRTDYNSTAYAIQSPYITKIFI